MFRKFLAVCMACFFIIAISSALSASLAQTISKKKVTKKTAKQPPSPLPAKSCTAAPAIPTLLSPSHLATGVSKTPKLDWSDVSGAESYDVEVAKAMTGPLQPPKVLTSQNVTKSEWIVFPELDEGTSYAWRARAKNSCGDGQWSNYWYFIVAKSCTAPPSTAPTLLSPTDRATGVSTTPKLDWTDVSGAISYEVDIAVDNNFLINFPHYGKSGLISSEWTVVPALVGSQYWWRVRASNACGVSPWSNARSFMTGLGVDIDVNDIYFDSSCNLHVKNKNVGEARIQGNLRQKIWINQIMVDDSSSMIDLAPHASVEKILKAPTSQSSPLAPVMPLTAATFTVTVKATMDADNKLQETNEANNTLTKTLSCTRR
jgi:hypothetical protein